MPDAALNKIKFVGYKDNGFSQKIGEYVALMNPETYSVSQGVTQSQRSGQGSGVPLNSYNQGAQQTINLKVLFDGTGLLQDRSPASVTVLGANNSNIVTDIAKFKSVVYDYQSDTHRTPFVQIQWGVLLFNCTLSTLSINYKLFKPDGTPIRAEADCSFTGSINDTKLAALENKQSPDLTHIRTVIEGDTLPLMCYREYGDSKYYYEVAKFNRLTDIKKLIPGTKIYFPPLTAN